MTDGSTGISGADGKLTWSALGGYSYVLANTNSAVNAPGAGESASEVFTYTVSDDVGGSTTVTLTFTA